ncbi:hypothetical protein D9M69_326890 [compost metagenome]
MGKAERTTLALPAMGPRVAAGERQAGVAGEVMESVLQDAFYYAFPLVAMGRLRLATVGTEQTPGRYVLQQWHHRRELSRPEVRGVTTPNADTLYSGLWLDLSQGPFRLSVPDTDGRYYSLSFVDMATNNFAMVGRRTTGTRAASFVIVGPDCHQELPTNMRVIRAPSNDVLVVSRILVNGDEDVPAVTVLQDQYGIEALGPGHVPPLWSAAPPLGSGPEDFVNMANLVLGRNPQPGYERRMLERFAEVGIGGTDCRWETLSPTVQAQWTRQWSALLASLEGGLSSGEPDSNGWHYNQATLGNFGTDYTYRAQIALGALLALEPVEAIYPSAAADHSGRPLTGRHRYRLTLRPEDLPVHAFWSLTMYQVEPDGKLYFATNPIRRYTIGDRTHGLVIGERGQVDIWIQHDPPSQPAQRPNWLPAPEGDFRLVLRAYEPSAALRDGCVRLPAVRRLE